MAFQFTDDTDTPIPITGWQFWAWVKQKPGGALVLDLDPQIVDDVNGIISITILKEDTLPLPPGHYTWDMIFETPDASRAGPVFNGLADIIELDTEPDITL